MIVAKKRKYIRGDQKRIRVEINVPSETQFVVNGQAVATGFFTYVKEQRYGGWLGGDNNRFTPVRTSSSRRSPPISQVLDMKLKIRGSARKR